MSMSAHVEENLASRTLALIAYLWMDGDLLPQNDIRRWVFPSSSILSGTVIVQQRPDTVLTAFCFFGFRVESAGVSFELCQIPAA